LSHSIFIAEYGELAVCSNPYEKQRPEGF
jgi:hypothetical protein